MSECCKKECTCGGKTPNEYLVESYKKMNDEFCILQKRYNKLLQINEELEKQIRK